MKPGARVAWFSPERAAEHLDLPNGKAFREFIARLPEAQRPRVHYLGRLLRFRQVDIDALVQPEPLAADAVTPLRLVSKGGR